MTVLTHFNRYFRRYRQAINKRRTERVIGSLPAEIRKDIGWPSQYTQMQPDDLGDRSVVRF
ncbi:hypothetical protein [Nitratireductor soli]|uniref:hypothetical protein n=1 Tax=Nitratireductor soli TaxID=1670619 RepID=UPI00065E9277|nr:hypothetical protein [Nitratireductor soli]